MPHILPTPAVLEHLIDVHCHPTVAPSISASTIESLPCTLCAMATQVEDQSKVAALVRARPDRVVPGFGYHPWWVHRISVCAPNGTIPDHATHYRALYHPPTEPTNPELETSFARLLPALPQPIPLADVLADVRACLIEFPSAMVGEVGIDRAARIPFPSAGAVSDGGNDDDDGHRTLSPFSTPFAHQLTILEAQLALAVELRRNVSLHSVKSSAQTCALFDNMAAKYGAAWFAISVDVHSCTLSPEVWRDIEVRPVLLHPPLHSCPTQRRRRGGERCLLMSGTETAPECILITLDCYQWSLAESYCTHPCVCALPDSRRVGLPRCVRCTGAHVGYGVYSCRSTGVAHRGRLGG